MRRLRPVASTLLTLIAVVLIALAIDVLAAGRELSGDDYRFQTATTRQQNLWEAVGLLPRTAGARVAGLDDDLVYRRTAGLFASVQPGRVSAVGPRIESLRGKAQLELTRTSQAERNPARRSRLLNFLAAMTFYRQSTTGTERANQLRTAIGFLQNAVQVDPENAEAKRNLEVLLRDAAGSGLPPPANVPSGERAGGPLSGVGPPTGSGY